MSYYFSKVLTCDFDKAVERVTLALKGAGFGIITEIDVRETFKRKLNADFRNYRILGACNPATAREAIEIEDKVGTMLPCNVVAQELGDGEIEIAAVDPVASMAAIENEILRGSAQKIRDMLIGVIERL